jgi:hypothetical protein
MVVPHYLSKKLGPSEYFSVPRTHDLCLHNSVLTKHTRIVFVILIHVISIPEICIYIYYSFISS